MASKDKTWLKLNLKLSGTLDSKFKIRYFDSENRIPSTTLFLYKYICIHTHTYIYNNICKCIHVCFKRKQT